MKQMISKNKLNKKQQEQIAMLADLSDESMDFDDVPEIKNWNNAKRGVFYRPVKQQITLRLDADLIDWFKNKVKDKKGYQTNINMALREYIANKSLSTS